MRIRITAPPALDRHHRIAFFAIEGPLRANAQPRRAIATALASATGVDAPSLRVSVGSASLSLCFDGERISSFQIQDVLNRKLAVRGLSVSLLKLMN